jgi:hypothetical protein
MGTYFTVGLALTYFYALILFRLAFTRFKNSMYAMDKTETARVSAQEINLERKKFSPWRTMGNQLKNLLFLLFSGQIKKLRETGYNGKITIDNVDVTVTGFSEKFQHICRPVDVPGDIRIGDWLTFTAALMKAPAGKTREFLERPEIKPYLGKKFKDLTDLQQGEILLALVDLGNFGVYLVNDIAAGLSRDFFLHLNDRLEEKAKTGTAVIYLSSAYIPIEEKNVKDRKNPFFPDTSWQHDIAFIRRSNKVKSIG